MQPDTKTIDQYLDEEQKLIKILERADLPEDERQTYSSALAEVQTRIDRLRAKAAQPPTPLEDEKQQQAPRREGRAPSAAGPKPAPATFAKPAGESVTILATLSGSTPTVKIDWGFGKQDELTEGGARSKFVTALRDLADSRAVKIDRFEALPRYITFGRALAYYRALTEFWGGKPTAAQLEISVAGPKRRIFEMIQNTAPLVLFCAFSFLFACNPTPRHEPGSDEEFLDFMAGIAPSSRATYRT